MAHICEICGKKTETGNMRSHSNRAARRTWKANLQKTTMDGKKVLACTNCMKTAYKQV